MIFINISHPFQEIFEKMDWDKNGTISCVEFKSYLQKMNGGNDILDHREVVQAFNQIDQDGSKQINWEEFYVRAKKQKFREINVLIMSAFGLKLLFFRGQ